MEEKAMNTMRGTRTYLLLATTVLVAASARAADPWETGVAGDDGNFTLNTLGHGTVQQHDLDQAGGSTDFDWMLIPSIAGHSYEARITGANLLFDAGLCSTCAQFERVTGTGLVMQEDASVVNEGATPESYDRTIRWTSTFSQVNEQFLRVRGNTLFAENAGSVYTVRFWDTTYSIPRWNNVAGQTTVFLIQNQTQGTVSGQIRLLSASGAFLHNQDFTLDQNQLLAFNTASIPTLVGLSGHAYVTHDAGYGGLAGKAVALEPATGFSFDTPMQPLPH
jgi:hypothetical protein